MTPEGWLFVPNARALSAFVSARAERAIKYAAWHWTLSRLLYTTRPNIDERVLTPPPSPLTQESIYLFFFPPVKQNQPTANSAERGEANERKREKKTETERGSSAPKTCTPSKREPSEKHQDQTQRE